MLSRDLGRWSSIRGRGDPTRLSKAAPTGIKRWSIKRGSRLLSRGWLSSLDVSAIPIAHFDHRRPMARRRARFRGGKGRLQKKKSLVEFTPGIRNESEDIGRDPVDWAKPVLHGPY